MGGSTRTVPTTSARTRDFQEFLYNTIGGSLASPPNYGNINYGSALSPFSPSSQTRIAAGGRTYIPTITRPEQAVRPAGGRILNEPVTDDIGGAFISSILKGGGEGVRPFGGRQMVSAAPTTGEQNTGGGPSGATPIGYVGPGSATTRSAAPRPTDPRIMDWWAGTAPDDGRVLSNIFASIPGFEGLGVSIPDLPGLDVAGMDPARMDAATIGYYGRRPNEIINPLTGMTAEGLTEDEANKLYETRTGQLTGELKMFNDLLGSIQGSSKNLEGWRAPRADLTTPTISKEGTETQSADQIVRSIMGENSMFTNNILPAYTNLFNQQNALTAAAAKESAGNLTGSGFANTLATALNRNNAQQEAQLSDILNALVSQEIGRQGAGAGLAGARNMRQAEMDLSRQTTSAQLAQTAAQLELQAKQTGNAQLMQMAQILNQRALQQAEMEQQASLTNAGFQQQAGMNLMNAENAANMAYFNTGASRNMQQAQMQQDVLNKIFGAGTNINMQNAGNYLQLLQMLFQGGPQSNTITRPGLEAMLPGLASILPFFL